MSLWDQKTQEANIARPGRWHAGQTPDKRPGSFPPARSSFDQLGTPSSSKAACVAVHTLWGSEPDLEGPQCMCLQAGAACSGPEADVLEPGEAVCVCAESWHPGGRGSWSSAIMRQPRLHSESYKDKNKVK